MKSAGIGRGLAQEYPGGARGWVILGNSGSGKSTLAREIAATTGAAVLDLDTVAWRADRAEPARRAVAEVAAELDAFAAGHAGGWVMEGCYGDLIAAVLWRRPVLVWLDVSAEVCSARVRTRAYEPHKYATPEAQAAAVDALAAWIAGYASREGDMGRAAHARLFAAYPGKKRRIAVS